MKTKFSKTKTGDSKRGAMQPAFAALPLRRCPTTALAVLAFALLAATPARAQTRWWDANTSSAGAQGGNGTWTDGGNNWATASVASGSNVGWSNAAPNSASFEAISNIVSSTLTLGSDITAARITNSNYDVTIQNDGVNTYSLTLIGSTSLVIAGARSMTFNVPVVMRAGAGFYRLGATTGTTTFNGVISETNGSWVLNTAAGHLVLNGLNTYTGRTVAGGNSSSAAVGSNLYINTLKLKGEAQSTGMNNVIQFGENVARRQLLIYTGTVATTTDKDWRLGQVEAGNLTTGAGFLNNGTGAVTWQGVQQLQGAGGTGARTLILGGSNADDNDWQSSIGNGFATGTSHEFSLTKEGAGKWILSGSNTFSGTTQVLDGTLRITNANALQNSPLSTSGTGTFQLGSGFTTLRLGGLTGSNALGTFITEGYAGVTTNLTLNTVAAGGTQSYTGNLADGASGMTLTKTGTGMQILGGVNSYTGDTTISAGTLRLGINGTSLPGNIANAARLELLQVGATTGFVNGLISGTGSVTMAGSGTVRLSNALNSYTGKTAVSQGMLEFASIGSVGGGASPLGAPTTEANGTIDLGSGTNAVGLRYVGSGTSTSNRVVNLAGSTGPVSIASDGTGALVLSTALTAAAGAKDLTLDGSSTANNAIVAIPSPVANVAKTGSGLWRLTGNSGYTGQLRILDGTLVVASNVGTDGSSPFGAGTADAVLPRLGNSAAGVSGTAAMLFDASAATFINRGFSVAALDVGSSQVAVIGATGSGTVSIGTNSTQFRLGRDVTLQAANGATAEFAGLWTDAAGTGSPAVAFTVGSAGNDGTVVLKSFLPTTATGLSIVSGTARLATPLPTGTSYWEPVYWTVPLTLGAVSGSAEMDLNGQSQSFQRVTFSNNSGIVSGSGTLWLYNDPGLTAEVTVSSGTGHVISSNAGLDAATTFNVNAASQLRISGGIGVGYDGAQTLTKSGDGILHLTNVNTYSGTTAVTGGRLLVDGAGNLSNTARVVVNGAGAELKWNSSAALSRPLDLVQGTISGTGTISATGGVTVASNAILSPGNSPGIQSYTTGLTWASGGSYLWEINDWTGEAGTAYDQLAVSGSPLNITATSGSTFNILITSLTGSNTAGNVPNFDGNASRTFTLATSSAGITGFDASKFFLDTSAFSNTYSGSFSITSTGSALLLNYLYTPAFTSTDYTLTAAAGTANIRVGGTTSITATVTNTGTGTADALAVSGLAVTVAPAGTVTLSPTSGTAAIDNGTVAGSGVFTGTAAGAYTFTPSVSSATNVNLATSATLTSTGSATVSVYNVAAPNSITGTISLGSIITGGTFGTQALTISNTAAAGSYSEKLDAVFGTPTGDLTASGSISLLVAGGTSTNMLVGLTSGTSVGVASGSVVVDFTSNGDGTSGLGTLSAGSQTVWVEGTVLAHSQASLLSTLLTSNTINLGTWDYVADGWLDGDGTAAFSIFNLASTSPELTAALEVTGTSMTGSSGFSFDVLLNSLIAGGTSAGYTASFDPDGFTTKGTYTAIFTILTSDQTNLSGATAGNTLTVTASVIVVPEPQAIALAAIGIAAAVYAARRRK